MRRSSKCQMNLFIRLSSWLLMTQIKQPLLSVGNLTSVCGAIQIKQNSWNFIQFNYFFIKDPNNVDLEYMIKGAPKSCVMHYSYVVIILFNTGLYTCAFSTYSFKKLFFSLCVVFLYVLFGIRCDLYKLSIIFV